MNKSEEKIYELLKSNVLFRDEKGIYTIFPQKLLIEASGKSERTVQRAIKGLEEQRYIFCELNREVNILKIYFSLLILLLQNVLNDCHMIRLVLWKLLMYHRLNLVYIKYLLMALSLKLFILIIPLIKLEIKFM